MCACISFVDFTCLVIIGKHVSVSPCPYCISRNLCATCGQPPWVWLYGLQPPLFVVPGNSVSLLSTACDPLLVSANLECEALCASLESNNQLDGLWNEFGCHVGKRHELLELWCAFYFFRLRLACFTLMKWSAVLNVTRCAACDWNVLEYKLSSLFQFCSFSVNWYIT